MKRSAFKYLIFGILFWGVTIALLINYLFGGRNLPIPALIAVYVVLTALLVLLVQFYIGGFPANSPKNWFFVPLGVWIFIGLWGIVESFFWGTSFSVLNFAR
jgi:hypothetical protein